MNKQPRLPAFYVSTILAVAVYGCAKNIKTDGNTDIFHPSVDKVTSQNPPDTRGVTFIPKSQNKDEILMVTVASDKVNEVVQSKCFADSLLDRDMIQTKGQTNEEVVKVLQSATGTIKVKFYSKRWTSEMAVRYPPSSDINFNRVYWTGNKNVCEWASTLAHEGLGHVLGDYDHDFRYSKSRDYSVPYSINFAFKQCCK
jgi:hypothetical protein